MSEAQVDSLIEAVALAALDDLLDRKGVGNELESCRDDEPVWHDIIRCVGVNILQAIRAAGFTIITKQREAELIRVGERLGGALDER